MHLRRHSHFLHHFLPLSTHFRSTTAYQCYQCLSSDGLRHHGSSAPANEPHRHHPTPPHPTSPGRRETLLQLLPYIYGTAEVKIVLARERSGRTSLTRVRRSDSRCPIQPDYIRKRLTKDFSLRSYFTVSIMTFGCRNAERQPKASRFLQQKELLYPYPSDIGCR
jgi:hypothetical protein